MERRIGSGGNDKGKRMDEWMATRMELYEWRSCRITSWSEVFASSSWAILSRGGIVRMEFGLLTRHIRRHGRVEDPR